MLFFFDGNWIVVGSFGVNDNGVDFGNVMVWEFIDGDW